MTSTDSAERFDAAQIEPVSRISGMSPSGAISWRAHNGVRTVSGAMIIGRISIIAVVDLTPM